MKRVTLLAVLIILLGVAAAPVTRAQESVTVPLDASIPSLENVRVYLEQWKTKVDGKYVVPDNQLETVRAWLRQRLGAPNTGSSFMLKTNESGNAILEGQISGQVILRLHAEDEGPTGTLYQTIDFVLDLKPGVKQRIKLGRLPVCDDVHAGTILKPMVERTRKKLLILAASDTEGAIYYVVSPRNKRGSYTYEDMMLYVQSPPAVPRGVKANFDAKRDGGTRIIRWPDGTIIIPSGLRLESFGVTRPTVRLKSGDRDLFPF